jgi:hypothetical protein
MWYNSQKTQNIFCLGRITVVHWSFLFAALIGKTVPLTWITRPNLSDGKIGIQKWFFYRAFLGM